MAAGILALPCLLEVFLFLIALAHAWTNEECTTCHPDVAERYAASRHAHAFDNANFVAVWRHADQRRWCASCHLPQGDPMGCDSCHQGHEPVATDVCQGCHTVPSPNLHPPLRFGGEPLQTTWDEWARVTTKPCAGCHLDGHRFPGGHDADQVRRALTVETAPGRLTLRTTDEVGHRVPTGDPFRRLEVALCATEACETIRVRRVLAVVHQPDAEGWLQVEKDTRLGPPGSPWPDAVSLEDPKAGGYRVRLLLADPALALPREERILDLFQGALP